MSIERTLREAALEFRARLLEAQKAALCEAMLHRELAEALEDRAEELEQLDTTFYFDVLEALPEQVQREANEQAAREEFAKQVFACFKQVAN